MPANRSSGRRTRRRLHDLRHSIATLAVSAEATLYLVGKVLGHKQSRTTEIYAHAADDPLQATAEIAAQRVAAARRGRAKSCGRYQR